METNRASARRRLSPVANDRPVTRAATKAIAATLENTFKKLGADIAAQPWPQLSSMVSAAADDRKRQGLRYFYFDDAHQIVRDLDLDRLDEAVPQTAAHLIIVASDTAETALGRTGVYGRDLADAADQIAVELAHNRAAELVGKKWSGGDLVENPDAKFAITDTTRDAIRDVIADGFANKKTVDEIAADIMSSTALSAERADLIARTEVASINNDVALAAYKVARDDGGVKLLKAWETSGSDNACDDCLENEAAGEIDLDDDFPSGDDAPPLHPRCECSVVAVTDENDEEARHPAPLHRTTDE